MVTYALIKKQSKSARAFLMDQETVGGQKHCNHSRFGELFWIADFYLNADFNLVKSL